MADHQDKGKIFMPISEQDKSLDTRKVMEAAAEAEAQKLTEAEIKEAERLAVATADLLAQYEVFKEDRSLIDKVDEMGLRWFAPGHIIELFVYRKPNVGLTLPAEALLRPTPFGKILASSTLNDEVQRLTPGTIVHLGDPIAHMAPNPGWEEWAAGKKTNQKFLSKEPPKFLKRIYVWITEGKLFYTDKARLVLDPKYTIVGNEQLQDFNGPFVFELDQYEIGRKIVIGNPWA